MLIPINAFPTPEHAIHHAGPDSDVVLWASCSLGRLGQMLSRLTAGGVMPTTRAKNVAPGSTNQPVVFTSSSLNAQMKGAGQLVVFVRVKKRYLKKHSGSFNGWDCESDAPVQILGYRAIPKSPSMSG